MSESVVEAFAAAFAQPLPFTHAPLVQCLTNEISVETVANALLAVNAKPVMADDPRELEDFLRQSDAVLLNLGHLSAARERSLLLAGALAHTHRVPTVVDLVGIGVSPVRADVAAQLAAYAPAVLKGNLSEVRHFVGLAAHARGVDGSRADATQAAVGELAEAMQAWCRRHPASVLLATGPVDLVVGAAAAWCLANGVPQLDRFTGTGDVVGALVAALLGSGMAPMPAAVVAVSYLNCCSEVVTAPGLASFRLQTLDQLSQLGAAPAWQAVVRGEALN